jgi:hypothetical protein
MASGAAFKDADPTAAEAAVVSARLVDALQWLRVRAERVQATRWGGCLKACRLD